MTLPPNKESNNYLMRHWRGEISLGVSYWVNGTLLAGIAPIVISLLLLEALKSSHYSLRVISLVSLSFYLISFTLWSWSVVGIWRSASNHVSRGGASGWAIAAKLMVLLGIVVMSVQLVNTIIPQAKELALIASGQDPIGEITIKVATNGQSVIILGTLREGSSEDVKKVLDATPSARTLVLNSNGGRLREAQHLARIVKTRNLDTYVENQCASACTYVFLAGRDRAATPNARIGFHQPRFPGSDAVSQQLMTQEMLDIYRTAKLPEHFVRRIGNTPAESMWYPTRDELIASNVITRVSLGGEASISGVWMNSKQEFYLLLRDIPLYQALEKRFPETVKEAVERGWAAKERGGNDADVTYEMRVVIAGLYPTLLKSADEEILESFLKLVIDQLQAARAISIEACTKLTASQLDITKTLPKDLVEREQKLLIKALTSPPRTTVESLDPAEIQRAIEPALRSMPKQYVSVIADIKSYANRPELVCEATIAFYRSIDGLPPRQRLIAMQGIFQNN